MDDCTTLQEQVREALRLNNIDCLEHGEKISGPLAIEHCLKLVDALAQFIMTEPDVKWGAFAEGDGTINFVLQHLSTDRRVSIFIGDNGIFSVLSTGAILNKDIQCFGNWLIGK